MCGVQDSFKHWTAARRRIDYPIRECPVWRKATGYSGSKAANHLPAHAYSAIIHWILRYLLGDCLANAQYLMSFCSAPARLFHVGGGRIGRRRASAVTNALSGVFNARKTPPHHTHLQGAGKSRTRLAFPVSRCLPRSYKSRASPYRNWPSVLTFASTQRVAF